MARQLADRSVNQCKSITIAARSPKPLEEAVKELKSTLKTSKTVINKVECDVTSTESCKEMVKKLEDDMMAIDCVFCCAGASTPGFFSEQEPAIFEKEMKLNYQGTINTIHPIIKGMIRDNRKGSIVFVCSTVALVGMVGYSAYAPTKWAIRGLAECLRQELHPYNISVHIYYVATIDSPGFAKEQLIKPAITKAIEEGDLSDPSPKERARTLLKELEFPPSILGLLVKDRLAPFTISSDIITDLFRCSGKGAAPAGNNCFLWELLLTILGNIFIPLWRWLFVDPMVRRFHKEAERKRKNK